MIKTLSKAQKMEREKLRIPRSVQDAIPIRRIFADGIFRVGNRYSKTWSFTDINYAIAGKEDKTSMFLDYSELLNALDSGASAKITIYNRRINKAEFERSVLLPDKDDGLDEYRHEFNQMLTAQVTGTSNSIVRERYLTVSVVKRNADEARSYFARVGTDLVTHLAQLSSVATELTLTERLHIFRDFFKAGEQAAAEFNIHKHAKRGQHFKDWFCPNSMEFAADHFKLDARYGRVLYLQDYASYIKDSFVSELCDLDRDLMLSIDILPVPTDEAARQLQSTLLGVETNVANWQRRQNANNNFIVGPSGSGKTTLCNMIARFWDVNSGSVKIGGHDVKEFTCDSLLSYVSMVFQKVYLFNDTIENNIKFGKPNATHAEVVEAAKRARCHDFIEALPQGYETMIGEAGSTLSGGEKQRISIARAILKDAPIVILDEATSSIDPENEKALLDAIFELTKNKTLISIAHRLSTVRTADQIIVIDQGHIVQKGTHKELAEKEGIYRTFLKCREKSISWKL